MNEGTNNRLSKALRVTEATAQPGTARHKLFSALAWDDPSERAEPRLPEVGFAKRTLPGELGWPRERLPRREVE